MFSMFKEYETKRRNTNELLEFKYHHKVKKTHFLTLKFSTNVHYQNNK